MIVSKLCEVQNPSDQYENEAQKNSQVSPIAYYYNTFYVCLISQPLHLDFCRQVSVFVRDCVLSSSGEQLRSLTKVGLRLK